MPDTVHASIAHAFHVLTTAFDTWWPREHHIGKADLLAAVIEPKAGGRWYEKGVDGSECEWGQEPVAVRPRPVARERSRRAVHPGRTGRTKVEFEHRHIERSAHAKLLRAGVDSPGGWTGLPT